MSLRVLVVDDAAVYRKIVGDILTAIPGVEVVGYAGNGRIALSHIAMLKPDLVTLDMEMPEMSGLEVLDTIKKGSMDIGVIIVSALTARGGELTIKALNLGAFDFITKPEGSSIEKNREAVGSALLPLIKTYAHFREIKTILKGGSSSQSMPDTSKKAHNFDIDMESTARRMTNISRVCKSEAVGIGISTGGPTALARMLPALPEDLNVPVFIVQHMPSTFTRSLAQSLDARCSFQVKEAEDGETVKPNTAYIAPGGRQMKVSLGAVSATKIIRVTDDPPENHCKPSVDYLFRSLAHHYQGRATGVVMTGMGNDGTLGLRLMKRHGAAVIAQDEATCIVFGMPGEAIRAGVVDIIAPLDEIAEQIVRTVR